MAKEKTETAPVQTNEYEQVIAELREQLKNAETSNERLKVSLELQEAKYKADRIDKGTNEPSGIEYGPSFNPVNMLDKVAEPFTKEDRNSKYRFISTHPTLYALRRSQGYEPVLDSKGAEVRQADTVLAKMPKTRFEAEVVAPRKETAALRKDAIEQRFHEQGKDLGVKTFGHIKYDGVNE